MRFITPLKCQFGKKLELFINMKSIRNFRSVRSGNKEPFNHIGAKSDNISHGNLWKPFGFTVLFSGATIVGATIVEYERFRAQTRRAINYFHHPLAQRTGWRHKLEVWWNSLSDGEKMYFPILFANVLVFAAWRVPAFQSTMMRYFCSGPGSHPVLSMVLSTFSHHSVWHLAANMIVLYTFCPSIVSILGKEQFVAFYLTSGVVSTFTSVLYKTMTGRIIPSLGASGAILGILGFFCMQFPEGRLGIIFIPMYSFPASIALKTVMGFDLAGCLFGWKFFDHAAHLGGALMGIFWQQWGQEYIWRKREPILELWHKIRS